MSNETPTRVFKTKKFGKNARNAGISDDELCDAIQEVMAGQAVDLGGGVYKKRLHQNQHRSIILAKGGQYWIYEYLFAKKDRDNIDDGELEVFRWLAKAYEGLNKSQLARLIKEKYLLEIFHADKKEIQE
jgi:hypothetical protein